MTNALTREADREVARLEARYFGERCRNLLAMLLKHAQIGANDWRIVEQETRIYLLAQTAAHHARLYLGC